MDQKKLDEILARHEKWLASEPDGERAVINGCDLHELDLSGRNLRGCDLSASYLSDCYLSYSDLRDSDLSNSNLSGCDLSDSDLSNSNLGGCIIIDCDLSNSNLSGCNMRGCNLSASDLCYCDMNNCDLSECIMSRIDLSGCDGLVSPIQYMKENFERSADGYIAYKVFNASYIAPSKWEIRPGAVIEETVNANRTDDCGCGINVATLDWVDKNYTGEVWKVLIRWEWLPGVCVPYNTDGKIRCERVELIEVVQ